MIITNNKFNVDWKIQVNYFPLLFDQDCQYLFADKNLLYLSKDGQLCAVLSPNRGEQKLRIHKVNSWTLIQEIKYNHLKQMRNCYFSADNQFALLERMEKDCFCYYIHNLFENKGKEFIFKNRKLTQFWTTQHINLVLKTASGFELYQIDKNFKLSFLKFKSKCLSFLTLEGMQSQRTIYTNNLSEFVSLHLNQFYFKKIVTKTYMKHLACHKVIRAILGDYSNYILIRSLLIFQQYGVFQFYDFSRGSLQLTLKGRINKNKNIDQMQVMGDHLASPLNGHYIGWKLELDN